MRRWILFIIGFTLNVLLAVAAHAQSVAVTDQTMTTDLTITSGAIDFSAGGEVTLTGVKGCGSAIVNVYGVGTSGAVDLWASVDDVHFRNVLGVDIDDPSTSALSLSKSPIQDTKIYRYGQCTGFSSLKVIAESGAGSGTAIITIRASQGGSNSSSDQVVSQGTAGNLRFPWYTAISDPGGSGTILYVAEVDSRRLHTFELDGDQQTLGAKADTGVVGDVAGSVSAKLRGINLTMTSLLTSSTFTGRINTLGQKAMAASTPIVIASDQSAVPISAAALPLPAGAATSGNQTTEIGSLASIKTNTDPLVASGAGGYMRQDSTATIAKETGGNLATTATNTGTTATNTTPLLASGAGGYVRQDSTATIAKETGGNLATTATNTGTTVTNTTPLLASGAGGYVRQDSTATIAKETGGNLASVKTNTDSLVAAGAGGYVRQDSTATIAKETGGNLATVKANTDNLNLTLTALRDAITTAINSTNTGLNSSTDPTSVAVAGGRSIDGIYAPLPLSPGAMAVQVAPIGGVRPTLVSPFKCNALRKTNCS